MTGGLQSRRRRLGRTRRKTDVELRIGGAAPAAACTAWVRLQLTWTGQKLQSRQKSIRSALHKWACKTSPLRPVGVKLRIPVAGDRPGSQTQVHAIVSAGGGRGRLIVVGQRCVQFIDPADQNQLWCCFLWAFFFFPVGMNIVLIQ